MHTCRDTVLTLKGHAFACKVQRATEGSNFIVAAECRCTEHEVEMYSQQRGAYAM